MALGFSRRGFFGLVTGWLGLAVSRRAASAPAPAVVAPQAAPPRGDFFTRRRSCVDGEWGVCSTSTYDAEGRLLSTTPAGPSSPGVSYGYNAHSPRS
jgi:hypothetical protein